MNISFYTASVGAEQQQRRLDVHGNNIANVNNFGFRAKVPAFSQLMTYNVRGISEDVVTGVGSRMEAATTNFRTTGLADTGRSLDYAIEGNGFFCLLDPATGEITYTRDGSFIRSQFYETDANGDMHMVWYLSDGLGRFVLDANRMRIEVPDPLEKLPVGIFDFVNYDGMLSQDENGLTPIPKNGEVRLSRDAELIQYALELSNVDLAYELTKVIESQRSFSFMLRMVTASDEVENTVNNLR